MIFQDLYNSDLPPLFAFFNIFLANDLMDLTHVSKKGGARVLSISFITLFVACNCTKNYFRLGFGTTETAHALLYLSATA